MPVNYNQRRAHWKKLAQELPDSLQGRISLRNVEAVSKLSPSQQENLAKALDAGLKHLSMAVSYLKEHSDVTVADLLQAGAAEGKIADARDATAGAAISAASPAFDKQDREWLDDERLAQNSEFITQLILRYFPGMNRIAAEALSSSSSMSNVLVVAHAHRQVLESAHIHADFVLLVFYGLLQQAILRLNELIEANPSHQQAVQQCGIKLTPSQYLETPATSPIR